MSWLRKNDHRTEHRFVEDRLSAYLDGELQPRERETVERHLAECEACRWNLETLRQTVRWARSLKPVPVPRAFTIPAQVAAPRTARPVWGVPLVRAAAVAVALLFVVTLASDYVLTGLVPQREAAQVAMLETLTVQEQAPSGEAQTMQEAMPEAAPAEPLPPSEEERSMAKAVPAADAAITPPPSAPEAVAETYQVPQPTETASDWQAATAAPPGMGMGGESTPPPDEQPLAGAAMALTVTTVVEQSMAMAEVATPTLSPPPSATTVLTAVVAVTMSTTTVRLTATLAAEPTPVPTATYGTSSLPVTPPPGVTPPTAVPTETPTPLPLPTVVPPTEPPAEPPAESPPTEPGALPAPAMATDAPMPTLTAEPTVVAAVPQQPQEDEDQGALDSGVRRLEEVAPTAAPWLRMAEIVLGSALVVLVVALVLYGLRRRRKD